MQPILLCNARLADGQAADLLVIDGIVAAVGPCGSLTQPPGAPPLRIDLTGQLLLPSLVDGHTHLDKTLWGRNAPACHRRRSARKACCAR
jgi:cytosine/creatinine deaminase